MENSKNCFVCGFEPAPHIKNEVSYCTNCFVKINSTEKPARKYAFWKKKVEEEPEQKEINFKIIWNDGMDTKEKQMSGTIEKVVGAVKEKMLANTEGWNEENLTKNVVRFIRHKIPKDEEIKKFCAGFNETILIEPANKGDK